MDFLIYLGKSLAYALLTLGMILVPGLLLTLLFQFCAKILRTRLAGIFGVNGYLYLTAPGVMIHELSHAFFCILFRHKITEMKLFSPQPNGTLGFVSHSFNPKSLYQRIGNFFISTGPVWIGFGVLAGISCFLLPSWEEDFAENFFSLSFWCSWQAWLWLYLFFAVSTHISLSKSDLKGTLDGFLFILLVFLFAYPSLGWLGEWEDTLFYAVIGLLVKLSGPLAAAMGFMLTVTLLCAVLLFPFRRKHLH